MWLRRESAPKRNGGSWVSALGTAIVVCPFALVREGLRGAAIFRLEEALVRGVGNA